MQLNYFGAIEKKYYGLEFINEVKNIITGRLV